jgi:undecaprenyl-phosphate 4-deoxy-4-formamido-L-arabinose transferase
VSEIPAFALSVVVPVYNGASSISILVQALADLEVEGGLEIVLVNDCSVDNSLEICRELCRSNKVPLTVVNLARNFGEHNAVMAGLRQASGAYVITMDDDLQNPPGEVVRLWQHARDNGYDVVYSYYVEKQHSFWRNLGSHFANWCAERVLDKPRPLYLSTFRCMSAFTVKAVLEHTGPFPFIDGLITQVTQNIGRLKVVHLPRVKGRSNYTLRRLLRLFLAMLFNFSVMPLRVASLVGVGMTLLGVLGFLAVLIEALSVGNPRGWASLMASVLVLAGVQLAMLGLIGEYVGRMFLTLNKKPQFVVRDVEHNDCVVEEKRLQLTRDRNWVARDLERTGSEARR